MWSLSSSAHSVHVDRALAGGFLALYVFSECVVRIHSSTVGWSCFAQRLSSISVRGLQSLDWLVLAGEPWGSKGPILLQTHFNAARAGRRTGVHPEKAFDMRLMFPSDVAMPDPLAQQVIRSYRPGEENLSDQPLD